MNVARTHCKNGHAYAEYGYYEHKGCRSCKECHRLRNVERRKYFREHKQKSKLRQLETGRLIEPVRFTYQHPETGRFASVEFRAVPRLVFDLAAKYGWSQRPEMIGWLYAQWKFHVPAMTPGMRRAVMLLADRMDERGRELEEAA